MTYAETYVNLWMRWADQTTGFLRECVAHNLNCPSGYPSTVQKWEAALDAATDALMYRGFGAYALDWYRCNR